VRGSMEPLLQVLAAAGVRQVRSREPSLEELFLTLYGDHDHDHDHDHGATGDG